MLEWLTLFFIWKGLIVTTATAYHYLQDIQTSFLQSVTKSDEKNSVTVKNMLQQTLKTQQNPTVYVTDAHIIKPISFSLALIVFSDLLDSFL